MKQIGFQVRFKLMVKFSAGLISYGTEFHSFGAATLNARSPNETVFVLGTFSREIT